MIDNRKLAEALTKALVLREYQVLYPQLSADFQDKARTEYLSNTIFNARVDGLVSGLMMIIRDSISDPTLPPY